MQLVHVSGGLDCWCLPMLHVFSGGWVVIHRRYGIFQRVWEP